MNSLGVREIGCKEKAAWILDLPCMVHVYPGLTKYALHF